MNIVVSLSDCPFVVPMPQLLCDPNLLLGIALRSHSDASGASAPTPALAGKSAARARTRTRQARTEREKTHHGHQKTYRGHQEKCQGGTACAPLAHIISHVATLSFLKHVRLRAERMQGYGEGPFPHAQIRTNVLPDAHATASGRIVHPDATQQPANGRRHAGCHSCQSFRLPTPLTPHPPIPLYHYRVSYLNADGRHEGRDDE